MYKIIGTGSTGNAVLYHNSILVSCGVPYSHIEPYIKDISIILLDHIHSDHFKKTTIDRIMSERPMMRIGCGDFMLHYVKHHKNVDVYKSGKVYNYGSYRISPVDLYHDVPNFGYRIHYGNHKTFHATDTAHLIGIEAENYDLYAIEHNYDEEVIYKAISSKQSRGVYSHERDSLNTHLSIQQAHDFFLKNKKDSSELIRLHETSSQL